jgi:DNA-binding MarR family transcriptional regulator
MLDKMSDASRIVDRLYKKGLLERKICTTDKRLVDVSISEDGLTLLSKIDGPIDDMTNLFGSITEEDAATLNQILDKLRD